MTEDDSARIMRKFHEDMTRIDAHYAQLARQRKTEYRWVMAWWLFWVAITLANKLVWHIDWLADLCVFANCILMAKAVYDAWRLWTGQYPPRPPDVP